MYSTFYGENISDEGDQHAKTVWKEFNFKTMKDYHNLCNKSDVLLLADVLENFREICMKLYGLDPAWYFTKPGLVCDDSWESIKVDIELLSDPNMLLMLENSIRGGLATQSHRYTKSNNKININYGNRVLSAIGI